MAGGSVNLNAGAQGDVLQDFSKALTQKVHNLTQLPDLLWQQLYNRLQREVKGVEPKHRRRSASCEIENNDEHF